MFSFNIFFSCSYWAELPFVSCFHTASSYYNRNRYGGYQTKSKKLHEFFSTSAYPSHFFYCLFEILIPKKSALAYLFSMKIINITHTMKYNSLWNLLIFFINFQVSILSVKIQDRQQWISNEFFQTCLQLSSAIVISRLDLHLSIFFHTKMILSGSDILNAFLKVKFCNQGQCHK